MMSKFFKAAFAVIMCGALAAGVVAIFDGGSAEAQTAIAVTHTNQRWLRVGTLTTANVQTDGGTKTISLPALPSSLTGLVVSDVMLNEKTQFVHTNNDGGTQTLTLDIGKSGALERYMKDVSLKQTSGTRTLGSGTTSVKPRNFELAGTVPIVTIVSGDLADHLGRVSSGAADVYFLVEDAPPAPR